MPRRLIGNDFGDLSRLQAQRDDQQQQAAQFAITQLATALQRMAAQNQDSEQFKQKLDLSKEQNKQEMDYRNRALDVGRENSIRESLARETAAYAREQGYQDKQKAKEDADAKTYAINYAMQQAEQNGEFNPDDTLWAKTTPEIKNAAQDLAIKARVKLKPKFDKQFETVDALNRAARAEQMAAGIQGNDFSQIGNLIPRGFGEGSESPKGTDPAQVANDLRERAKSIREQYKIDEGSGIALDPNTGRYRGDFPTWYTKMRNVPIKFNSAQAFQPPVVSRPAPVAPVSAAGAAPVPMTATNQPPSFATPPAQPPTSTVNTNSVTIKTSDGRTWTVPTTNIQAVLARDPGAQLIQ